MVKDSDETAPKKQPTWRVSPQLLEEIKLLYEAEREALPPVERSTLKHGDFAERVLELGVAAYKRQAKRSAR